MEMTNFHLLLSGHDTIECAYYLAPDHGCLLDAPAQPPACAAAGSGAEGVADDDPRLVIRGERIIEDKDSDSGESYTLRVNRKTHQIIAHPQPKLDGEPHAAITDYLNTTFPFSPTPENLISISNQLFEILGSVFAPMVKRRGGLHGYQDSYTLGESKAMFAYGGQAGTALVSLPGEACALIQDWSAVVTLFGDTLAGRITRWDGAVDVYEGSPSVDDAVSWYLAGRFNAGGNKPSYSQSGGWIEPDGRGRTFYVGNRKNGKLIRIYEKGKQLGCPDSPWVRWEIELHNKDRIIPWEVLLSPGSYVAGAYPKATGWINEKMDRVRTIKESSAISYNGIKRSAKLGYGKLIYVMMKREGSAQKVIEMLSRPGVPRRLIYGMNPLLDGGED